MRRERPHLGPIENRTPDSVLGSRTHDDLHDQEASQSWGAVVHDEDLTDAIVDRILERAHLLQLRGPRYVTHQPRRDDFG